TAPQPPATPASAPRGPGAAPPALGPARKRGRFPSTTPDSTTHPGPSATPSLITAPGATSTSSASLAPPDTNAPAEISAHTGLASAGRSVERLLQPLQHPDHAQPALAVGPGAAALDDALHEVLAL